MTDTIHRHEIPVDDQWHTYALTGPVLHMAARRSVDTVEFWTRVTDAPPIERRFRVYGTGHPIPKTAVNVKSTLAPAGLVWHLLEDTA